MNSLVSAHDHQQWNSEATPYPSGRLFHDQQFDTLEALVRHISPVVSERVRLTLFCDTIAVISFERHQGLIQWKGRYFQFPIERVEDVLGSFIRHIAAPENSKVLTSKVMMSVRTPGLADTKGVHRDVLLAWAKIKLREDYFVSFAVKPLPPNDYMPPFDDLISRLDWFECIGLV